MEKSTKSKIKITVFALLSFILIILIALYTTDSNFRSIIDTKILHKQVFENTLDFIELNSDDNPVAVAYDNLIGIYSKNNLSIYTENAKKLTTFQLNITSPIFSKSANFLAIAEKNGQEIYVIKDTNIFWQTKIEGNILKIDINKNGYLSVISSTSTYNSVIQLFDNSGNKILTSYSSSAYGVSSSISEDNSYLAIGEVDFSGTVLKSYVQIISIETAKSNPENSMILRKEFNDNIITNIKYYDKENAICMLKDSVIKISPKETKELFKVDKDTLFLDINLKNTIATIQKQSSGLFSYNYHLKFIKTNTPGENLYILNNKLPKQVLADYNSIVLNYGSSVDIINQKGRLEKTYSSSQQIKDLIIGKNIVGIIYKDKIEIINL